MSESENRGNGKPEQLVRVLQIITFGLLAGAAVFFLICLVMNKFAFNGQPNFLSWIGIGFAGVAFFLHLLVPGIMVTKGVKAIDAQKIRGQEFNQQFASLFPIFQTKHIVGCALLEGAIFFNVAVYQSTSYLGNLVAGCVLLFMMLLRFPMFAGCETWVRNKIEELEFRTGS